MKKEEKKDVKYLLMKMFMRIGIDIPDNFETILQFCISDIEETASANWNDDDVLIAFRRFIETK